MNRFCFVCCTLFILPFGMFSQTPFIASVEPAPLYSQKIVSVTGSDFGGALSISISGAALPSSHWHLVTAQIMLVTLPSLSVGVHEVYLETTASGSNTFTITTVSPPVFVIKPTITGIVPAHAEVDDWVTISGINFFTVLGVYVNGAKLPDAAYEFVMAGIVVFKIPVVSQAGTISVAVQNSAGVSPAYSYSVSGLNKPKITDVIPQIIFSGERLTIEGINFTTILGVTVGNQPADLNSFLWITDSIFSILTPNLPMGGHEILVNTPRGLSNSVAVQILPKHMSIVSLSGTNLRILDVFTIVGTGFADIRAVIIGNFTTTGFTLVNSENIAVVATKGGVSGPVKVVSGFGMAESTQNVTIDANTNTVTEIDSPLVQSGITILYPNPCTDWLVYESAYNASGVPECIDLLGTVYSVAYTQKDGKLLFDTRSLPAGVYYFRPANLRFVKY